MESFFLEAVPSDSDAERGAAHTSDEADRRRRRKVVSLGISASAAALVLVGLSAALTFRGTAHRSSSPEPAGQVIGLHATAAARHCHTAVPGEKCYKDVQWARVHGIYESPQWYKSCPTLHANSSFEEFQACVLKLNRTTCALPCNPAEGVEKPVIALASPPADDGSHQSPCHVAVKGERCYDHVTRIMREGGAGEKYPGLTEQSTFEEIQAALHDDPKMKCPQPCGCHTARASEACYAHVRWAMSEGVHSHPEWYPNLSSSATFEDVQLYLRKDARHNCPIPCGPTRAQVLKEFALEKKAKEETSTTTAMPTSSSGTAEDAVVVSVTTTEKPKKTTHKRWVSPWAQQPCHTAAEGEQCWRDTMYAMTEGIYSHPNWYSNLSFSSTFEQFQAVLHDDQQLHCATPCPCHTAEPGEECANSIRWVIREGIAAHPEWYEGLTMKSRVEDVQRRLHEDADSPCGVPCTPKVWGTPSLFCFSIFRSQGYELELVSVQVEKGAGIFQCDEFMVLSDAVLDVAKGIKTTIIPPCETVGVSKDGTAANTLVFMQAWGVIYQDARWRAHDWIIKADPDAVVLVDRMRAHLLPHTGKNTWITNCMKYTGPGWPMMFGSLEAFSYRAMETYYAGAQRCRDELQWQAWGEDLFMGNCLSLLGATSNFDGGLIGDNVCKGANCADGTTAAYHPFKSVETWFACYDQATSR